MGMGGFGGPMGGFGGGWFPQNPFNYSPQPFNYGGGYNRMQAFMFPMGVSPAVIEKMEKASKAFREYDKDNTGTLDKEEWKNCIKSLNINIPSGDLNTLYSRIDRDNSGKITEREFCEWYSSCY
ncbi:EF-hand [Neocallimastix californiae]|uniref:EF-hand n=1 Tax=Neocallimastix californiae TaxID=1754190 RepID=A0A1Y2A4F3_9FUNG|nr:EF-hand [Neocallimastix californiae]|eukprot:ORY17374.1 EF-hand [Neocallimastix californiae]